ncbi:uncharacterized protein DUF4352 [Asanoa ferruginea]|uniref:Uncharacterized protein DUF4352 n=1 Tax=Asanoa ferruginea TaxID=53367 RepID=A0A3D9ZI62_9ACTN|nr:DUF4352 domain-containing protein [Asanoa ferruginea]REF97088.1 uncharacterized protein DUF4352 [Asanoa ferruginea]GIF50479.1 hypothetical protein Afe04nite_50180 [Asanoa ferruginea]
MTNPYGSPQVPGPPQYGQSPNPVDPTAAFGAPPGYPAPPTKKKRWLVPTLVGGGLVLVLCCGGAIVAAANGDDKPDTKQASDVTGAGPAAAPPATKAAAEPTTEPATEPEPEGEKQGPPSAKVGKTIVISGGLLEGDEMAFTVKSVKPARSDNMFTQPGAGKKYIAVDISVLMKKGDALMTGNEITLQGQDGEVYNNQFVVHDDAFEWAQLSAGQRKSGLVFFEVPKAFALKGAKVLVRDFWDSKPAGAWLL